MSTTLHCCLSVRGYISAPARARRNLFKHPTEPRNMTPEEARETLMDELAKGHEVLPFGPPCEGFDYKTGCPGHPNTEDGNAKA